MTTTGWAGGHFAVHLAEVRKLNPDIISRFRDELARHQRANVQTNVAGAVIILQSWRNKESGDKATYEYLIREISSSRGSEQTNLTGMIGLCEQLLYDMSVK